MSLNLVLDLDQGTSKLLDSVWHCLVGFNGPVHNFPENLHIWEARGPIPGVSAFIIQEHPGQTLRIPGLAPAWSLTLDMWISSWYQTCRSVSLFHMWTCCHHSVRPPSFGGIWEKSVMRIKRRALVCGYNLQNHSHLGVAFPLLPHSLAPKQVKLVDHGLCFQESLKLNWLFYSEIIKCSPNFFEQCILIKLSALVMRK